MRRREFATALGGAAAIPLAARAQQGALPVIGWLSSGAPVSPGHPNATAFRDGLREAGFVEGRTVAFDYRTANGQFDRLPALAADLVARRVNVIVAIADPAIHAAARATPSIPIVFVGGDDPLSAGLGASLARPGGNLTGITILTGQLNIKRLELLRELAPAARKIGLLVNPANPATKRVIEDMQQAAHGGGLELHILQAGSESQIAEAFAKLVEQKAEGLIVDADVLFISQSDRIAGLAAGCAVPAIYGYRSFVVSGGLVSYAADLAAIFRQAGVYSGKILAGNRPGDLPIQQPTKFELVVNLKTAKSLGLALSAVMLARADETLE